MFKKSSWAVSLFLWFSVASCSTSPSDDSGSSSDSPAERLVIIEAPQDHGRSEKNNPEFEAEWNTFYQQPHDQGDTLVIGTIGDADSLNDLTSSAASGDQVIGLLFLGLTRTNPD
jgi:hypothetical protein